MQERKTKYRLSGLENLELENAQPKNVGPRLLCFLR